MVEALPPPPETSPRPAACLRGLVDLCFRGTHPGRTGSGHCYWLCVGHLRTHLVACVHRGSLRQLPPPLERGGLLLLHDRPPVGKSFFMAAWRGRRRATWITVPPIKTSASGDLQVWAIMMILTLGLGVPPLHPRPPFDSTRSPCSTGSSGASTTATWLNEGSASRTDSARHLRGRLPGFSLPARGIPDQGVAGERAEPVHRYLRTPTRGCQECSRVPFTRGFTRLGLYQQQCGKSRVITWKIALTRLTLTEVKWVLPAAHRPAANTNQPRVNR